MTAPDLTATPDVDENVKTCAREQCGREFRRNPANETKLRFARRRHCSHKCRIQAMDRTRRLNQPVIITPAEVAHRYVELDGRRVWRPSAPGFPDHPGGAS